MSISITDSASSPKALPQPGENSAQLPHSGANLALLAARACGASIGLVVRLENGELVFSTGSGFAAEEREGLVRLCAATLETPPRVPPLPARAAPGIHFYRGVPLVREDGVLLGALAVMDRVPRSLSPAQEEDLATLAGLVAGQLDLQRQHEERQLLDAELSRVRTAMRQTEEDAHRLATRLGIITKEDFFSRRIRGA